MQHYFFLYEHEELASKNIIVNCKLRFVTPCYIIQWHFPNLFHLQ